MHLAFMLRFVTRESIARRSRKKTHKYSIVYLCTLVYRIGHNIYDEPFSSRVIRAHFKKFIQAVHAESE
jgi:hypothetical protein